MQRLRRVPNKLSISCDIGVLLKLRPTDPPTNRVLNKLRYRGFIKTKAHRPTDYRPTDPPTTYHLPNDPPTYDKIED